MEIMDEVDQGQRFSISLKEFFELWRSTSKNNRNQVIFDHIKSKLNVSAQGNHILRKLKSKIKLTSLDIEKKMNSTGNRRDRFVIKYNSWLTENKFSFGYEDADHHDDEQQDMESSDEEEISATPGRPKKVFKDCSDRSKRMKVQDLLQNYDNDILCYAAQMSTRASGSRIAADLIKSVSESPEEVKEMRKSHKQIQNQRQFTREEALALFIDAKLSRNSYKNLRKKAISVGHQIYPSVHSLSKAKKECYPPDDAFHVTDVSASIKVQDIVNLTVDRLLKVQEPVISTKVPDQSTLTLICKYGGDGSSGHSIYKQRFNNQESTDEYLFVLSFVPIQLRMTDNPLEVIWDNPHPSSTRLCRAIKFIFAKETEELSTREFEDIRTQIQQLDDYSVTIAGKSIKIKFEFALTMIDGKIANYLTAHRSTQSCYICGAKPSEMNNPNINRQPNPDNYKYGLSSLHALIKMFECLLHISYRLDVKKWAIKDKNMEEKALFESRKANVRARFKTEMSLIVDKPKAGAGTSNDGNTARRFFKNVSQSADITGIDERLIKRFDVILICISSGHNINIQLFEKYLQETRDLYLELYRWYFMPPSVHKILHHGAEVIKHCIVPIGQLSEEAQEARNKDCRRFRLSNTRKTSRENSNRDLINMLLLSSDPVVNSYRDVPVKPTRSLPAEVLDLLIEPQIPSHPIADRLDDSRNEDYSKADSTEYDNSDEDEYDD